MKKILSRISLILVAFLVAMIGVSGSLLGKAFAANGNIINQNATDAPGGVKLYKTAEVTTEDLANIWDITLKVESPETYKATDTVIVVDRSSSMASKLDGTKSLVKSISTQLLQNATMNRVAIVSFADQGTDLLTLDFTNNNNTVATAVDTSISAAANDGAFTQAALNKATELLDGSSAEVKNIVLISDSESNYSFGINSFMNCSQYYRTDEYGRELYETVPHVKTCVFNDSRVGEGTSFRTYIGNVMGTRYYYNHGNAAIAAINPFKVGTTGEEHNVVTVAVSGISDAGSQILGSIASDDSSTFAFNPATQTGATNVLNKINDIKNNAVIPVADGAEVIDEIATGFTAIPGAGYTVVGSTVKWTPEFVYDEDEDIYTAEVTYQVEINGDIFTVEDEEGYYPLNDEATISYQFEDEPATGSFPIPMVDPVMVKIKKVLEGQDCEVCKFEIALTGTDGESTSVQVYGNDEEGDVIAKVFKEGAYTIEEIATIDNDVALENYLIDYSTDEIEIVKTSGEDFEITVTNSYETVDINVTTNWDDGLDQDRLRPSEYSVTLLGNGEPVEVRTITKDEGWETTFEALPKNYNGEPIVYELESSEVEGYDVSVDGDMEDGFKVTYTHTPAVIKPNTGFVTGVSNQGSLDNSVVLVMSMIIGTTVLLGMSLVAKSKK